MKRKNLKTVNCAAVVWCAMLLLYFITPALCDENNTALMLEMSPSDGGYLNIVPGVHSFDKFAQVALTATPKPGYQFVCWLGNVANTTTGSTSVFLDSPKMVIAVFEKSKFETPGLENDYVTSGGGGGLVRGAGQDDTSLEQASGAKRPSGPRFPHIPHNVPVPPDNGETPPPAVPEPATIALFLTGFLMLTNRRSKGVNLTDKK